MKTRYFVDERYQKIPQPIRELALNNPCVHRIIELYIHGSIITWEEALSQMVVQLTTDWEKVKKSYIDLLAMQQTTPIFVKS